MSVAFRRESDEEHLEPRFERPLPAGPNLVTKAGLALIGARIATLDAALTRAAEIDREAIRRDLRYWHTRRTTALLTPAPADGTAGFGTRVTFTMNAVTRTIAIVGDDEADPASAKLAFGAPLARAVMGSEAGELVAFNGREDAIALVSVKPIDG